MFNLLGNKKLKPFGLDISGRNIKIMRLERQKDGLVPVSFGMSDIPPTLINNHVITSDEKLATLIMKTLAMSKGLDSQHAVVSVPEAKSFVRVVTMPTRLEDPEIATALPWELEQHIPVPVEQVYLDWQVVERTDDKTKVLAMATPREYIDVLLSALALAKIKPVAVELEPQSTSRAAIGPEDREQSVLLVDLASIGTSFTVVSKGVLEYTSSIPVGGNTITENIMAGMAIQQKEAEKLKLETGLLADTKKGNVKQMMLSVLDSIIDEIKNVVKYHDDHALYDQPITKVILCGGGAKLMGVEDYMGARLNLGAGKGIAHVSLCDPWVNVSPKSQRAGFPSEADSQNYTTAIGLALRGLESDESH
jgi:type IV pilus assembly protein PilM